MSNKIDYQHVYLYMDDSGKISKYEDCAIFVEIVFENNSQKSSVGVKKILEKSQQLYDSVMQRYFGKETKC